MVSLDCFPEFTLKFTLGLILFSITGDDNDCKRTIDGNYEGRWRKDVLSRQKHPQVLESHEVWIPFGFD